MFRALYIATFISIVLSNQSPLIDNYHTYQEVQTRLNDWDNLYGNNDNPQPSYYSNSGIIYKLEQIGFSNVNSLPIYAVKLSYNADLDLDKPKVLILGQCHAEEIYGVEISMALIEMFLDPSLIGQAGYEYLPDPGDVNPYIDLRNILSRIEIWVVPTHNPDGLQIVHGYEDELSNWVQDVSYRKNITDANNNGVFDFIPYILGSLDAGNDLDGVDLNRNYDFHFDKGGAPGDLHADDNYGSCGYGSYRSPYDYYRGPSAFSESEVTAIRDFALEKDFMLSIAYHSSRSGCVSEKVIYPWDWKAKGKVSPDYTTISTIGDNIAALIPTQERTLHDLDHYKGSGSYTRRGQAHDWFYAKTGCFQYLVEMGTYGDEGIQTSSVDFYNEVIKNNFNGLFYLLRRSLGVNLGTNVDQYGITGLVTNQETGQPIQDVIYQVDEIFTSILDDRKTDSFGRYRWLLSSDDNSKHISFLHWDYEPLLSQDFNISSSSITNLDVQLVPKVQYQTQFNLSGSGEALLVLTNSVGLVDSIALSSNVEPLSIPEGVYGMQVIHDGYCPIIDTLTVESDGAVNFDLNMCNDLAVSSPSWNIINGDPFSYSSTGSFYGENLNICKSYAGNGDLEGASFVHFNMAYELEWEQDSLLIYLSDENVPDYIYTGENWADSDYYIQLDSDVDYSDKSLRFCVVTDDSFGYKGVQINDVGALSGTSDFNLSNKISLPNKMSISQNHPNPFNPATEFNFSISNPSNISLIIYNLKGDLVDGIIDNKYYNAGKFSIMYEPSNLSSGVYFYQLTDGQNIINKKMIYLK